MLRRGGKLLLLMSHNEIYAIDGCLLKSLLKYVYQVKEIST